MTRDLFLDPLEERESILILGVLDQWYGVFSEHACANAGVYIVENTDTHRFTICFHCCGVTDSIVFDRPASTNVGYNHTNLVDAITEADILRGSWPMIERPDECIGPPMKLVLGEGNIEWWKPHTIDEQRKKRGDKWVEDPSIRSISLSEINMARTEVDKQKQG
jgi:hypothetical protein